ncbi:MAG: hypothetical protein H0U05_03925 [Actinobacteria bacterium]|nr:hypothetical protein [Actinomycetota bacterium]
MRTEVIATHGNDFDAFAATLPARRLYAGSVVAVSGSTTTPATSIACMPKSSGAVVESSRLEQDVIRRLIVIEITNASRVGGRERVALDPSVEKVRP